MVQKANTLMKQVWKSYMQSYFLESRRNMLLEKVANINESLSAVTMKVQE